MNTLNLKRSNLSIVNSQVCGTFPGDCARQEFIFEFSTASNPDIFSVLPRLDEP